MDLTPRIVFLAICGWLVLSAAVVLGADAGTESSQTVFLDYQEAGVRLKGWRLAISPQSTNFVREPDFAGRTVGRGIIQSTFSGVDSPEAVSNRTINLPFAWDYLQGRLYLDDNRNGDLTDDPSYATEVRPASQLRDGSYFYQTFTNIHLTIPVKAQAHRVRAEMAIYGYNGKEPRGGNLTWLSYWQGKVRLQDREWQIGLVEDPNHLGSTEGGYLLLRPWSDREKNLSLEDGLMMGFEICTNLFLNGQGYQLTATYQPGEVPKYQLELKRVQPELGDAVLTGKFIDRMVLSEHQAKVPYKVVLDRPESKVKIPVGTYGKCWVVLKEKDAVAFSDYRDWFTMKPMTFAVGQATVLNMGGPLTNSATVINKGRQLSLEYHLLGAGGGYRLASLGNQANVRDAQYTVSQGGKQIETGSFQYG